LEDPVRRLFLTAALAGCAAAPDGPSGALEVPLVATAADGATVRLVDAALRVEGPGEPVQLFADAATELFFQDLPPGETRVELTGPWRLERDGRPVEARLAAPVGTVVVRDGETATLTLRFETDHGPVTFGGDDR
jgi:hypothetical protein